MWRTQIALPKTPLLDDKKPLCKFDDKEYGKGDHSKGHKLPQEMSEKEIRRADIDHYLIPFNASNG